MANTDTSEWRLLDSDLVTVLGILPASESHLYLVLNEPGAGELKIPLGSVLAGSVESGQFAQCSYRGAVRGGFFIENISKGQADSSEGGGQWVSISGRGALSLLEDAIIWDDGTSASTRDFAGMTKAAILIALIDEAQARGALANLSYDFTAVLDSDGAAWTDSETYKLNVGSSLLDMVRQFARTGIDFDILPGTGAFVLSAYKLGMGSDKSETVYFRTGVNCEEVTSDEHGDKIKNAQLIAYKGGYISVSDAVSIAARRRREKLLDLKMAQTASSATTIGAAEVELSKDPKKSISVKIYDGAGPRGFVDYDLGDYIMLDVQGTETRYRIYGVQPDWKGDQFSTVIVELNSILYENDIQLAQDVDWLMDQWSTANDANLLAVSFWAAIGDPNIVYTDIKDFAIIGDDLYVIDIYKLYRYKISTGSWEVLSNTGSMNAPQCMTAIGTTLYIGAFLAFYQFDTLTDTLTWVTAYYSVEPMACAIYTVTTDGTDLYAAGYFSEINSVAAIHFAKLDTLTGTWSAMAGGNPHLGSRSTKIYFSNGLLYSTPLLSPYQVKSWNGSVWSNVGSAFTSAIVSFATYGSNLLGGGGDTGCIFLWDGATWEIFGGGVNGAVRAISVYLTDVYIGGSFTDVGNYVSRYSGGTWWSLESGTNAAIDTMLLRDQDLYIAGDFTVAGDKPAQRLAAYFNNFQSLAEYLEGSSSFDMGAAIHNAPASGISDSDEVPFWEDVSATLRKITWTNIKATIKTYFDTLYVSLTQTANRVIVSNGSGVVATDASLVFSSADKSLTIGTVATDLTTAQSGIFQGADGVSVANFLQTFGTDVASYVTGLRGRGTALAPTAVQDEDILFRLRGRGYDSAGNAGLTSAEIRWVADQTHTTIAHGARLEFYTTPNNSTSLSKVLEITSAGTLELGGSNWYSALPYGGLHVTKENGGAFVPMVTGHSYGDGTGNFTNVPTMSGDRAGGTVASPTAVLDDMGLCRFSAGGYDGTALSGTRAQMLLAADGNWTGSSHPTKITFWTTPAGSTTRAEVFEIANDGSAIHTANAVYVSGATNPAFISNEGGGASLLLMRNVSTTQSEIQHYNAGAGSAIMDINPVPSDGAGASAFRFFRSVTTLGRASFTIYNANVATPVANHDIAGNGHTYLSGIAGYNINIGGATAPASKLFIQGGDDRTQLTVRGYSTQTSNLVVFENSAGTDLFTITNVGNTYFAGNVGVGIAPAATTSFYVSKVDTQTSGAWIGANLSVFSNPASAASTVLVGFQGSARSFAANAQNFTGIFTGVVANATHQGSGTMNTAYGGQFYNMSTGGGTITNAYSIYITNSPVTGVGSAITNQYGIYIEALTSGGTSNTAILVQAGNIVFNESGSATSDFRVESDTEANFIFLDANGSTDGALYLGGSTNGIQILKGGEMSFIGTATVWDDLRIAPDVKGTGAKDPSWVAWLGSVNLYDFDNAAAGSEKELWFNVQIPHGWKEGSSVYPHVHWTNKTAGTAGHVVRWGLEYTVAKIGGTFPTTVTVYGTSIVGGGDITVANEHMITSFDPIAMTGNTISTILSCRLFRNSSNAADTYTGTAGLLSIDWHYEVDKIGSKTEFA